MQYPQISQKELAEVIENTEVSLGDLLIAVGHDKVARNGRNGESGSVRPSLWALVCISAYGLLPFPLASDCLSLTRDCVFTSTLY